MATTIGVDSTVELVGSTKVLVSGSENDSVYDFYAVWPDGIIFKFKYSRISPGSLDMTDSLGSYIKILCLYLNFAL